MNARDADPGRRTAAGRALDVLGAFGQGHRALSLSEIARRADLSLSTTHRLTSELVAWGALERGADGQFSVGLRMLELSALAPRGLALREAASAHLHDLHRGTQGNVHLSVRDGHEVVYVEALRSRDSAQTSGRVGDRWPMHATGTGMVLLAHADPELRDAVLAGPLPRYTQRTVTDPAELRSTLAAVRRDGVAVLYGQIRDDMVSVSVPVRDRSGDVRAALSLVVLDDDPRTCELAALLTATAARISRSFDAAERPERGVQGVRRPDLHPIRPLERSGRAAG